MVSTVTEENNDYFINVLADTIKKPMITSLQYLVLINSLLISIIIIKVLIILLLVTVPESCLTQSGTTSCSKSHLTQ